MLDIIYKEKKMKPIDELTFTDDYMFGHVMQNPDICRELLERLLRIQIEKVEFPELQKAISSFYETKSIRLDVYVKNSDKIFDIEIQNRPEINLPKRTRYYQAMLDMDHILKGDDYSSLKECYIIFLCQFDPFGYNLPCYTFVNKCAEDKTVILEDKSTKMFFNSTAYEQEENVEISALLKYIYTKIPTDDFTSRVNAIVEESKISEKFRTMYLTMNLHDRDLKLQAFREGEQKGQLDAKLETAKKLLEKNIPVETIAECTGLSNEDVEKLKDK